LRALLAIKQQGPGRMVAAHYNHRLRAHASDEDAKFISEQCATLGVPLEIGAATQPGSLDESGMEERARDARLAFLRDAAEQVGARYVATGHTADDQAETVLFRVLRGTSIAGLAGIPRVRQLSPAVTLVRPLLEVRRSDVIEYLNSIGQAYREDESNRDVSLSRDRIRHELMPTLASEYNADVVAALCRLGRLAGESQAAMRPLVEEMSRRVIADNAGDRVIVDCRRLEGAPRHIIREVLVAAWGQKGWPMQSMGFDEWDALAEMAQSTDAIGKAIVRVFPGAIQARRAQHMLLFVRVG
jgi:tRNA(Ile)-lysidine synthase